MEVLPFATVQALVRGMSSAAWADFTVGKEHTSSVSCGETGITSYHVYLEISFMGTITK